MEFEYSPRWVHGFNKDGKARSLICYEEDDFKVLIQGGYTDSPKAAKEGKKHPLYEHYFDSEGTQIPEVKDVETDIPLEEIENLSWPELKAYAKKLEGVFETDIIGRHSKKDEVIAKIKELRNANSPSADK